MRHLFFLLYFGVSCAVFALLQQSRLEKLKNVRYLVFTKDKRCDIRDADFTDNATTVFIIHGYDTKSLENPEQLKDDILEYEPDVGRVVLVCWLDYSTYSGDPTNAVPYRQIASVHVPFLANDLNEKLMYINKKGAEKIRLIGHCLGAHVAGQSGRLFKQKTGKEISSIVGLDPTAPYFTKNPNWALNKTDANNVTVFHSNSGKYGYQDSIGTNDIYVNGGKIQPQCRSKLREDVCSHNQAWQIYSKYLKENVTDTSAERVHNQRFVICLDVSASMDVNNRLQRAVESAKTLISKMKIDSTLGIVKFSELGETTHEMVEIKSEVERNALVSSLPEKTVTSTSISAGLRRSMEMLKEIPESDEVCSTIFLISDGEHNTGESPENVVPDLLKACIRINSIALGADASQKLEEISGETNGVVFNVNEDGGSQQNIDTEHALSFSYDNEIDADNRPIYLPSKPLGLNNGVTMAPFIIDENIGKDTEFKFFSDNYDVDVNLRSPTGHLYSSTSPEYSYYNTSKQSAFKFDLADPGQWKFIVKKALSKIKRSVQSSFDAMATVKTHQIEKNAHPIRLDVTVSHRTLEYPKSIIIYAELRQDKFPIIHAQVHAVICGSNQDPIILFMKDDGTFPDEVANDGVYTASIMKLLKPERYTVSVIANGTGQLVPKEIDYFTRDVVDCNILPCKTLSFFERETAAGSIKLLSTNSENLIAPNPVTDLRAIVYNENRKQIALNWTSPADKVFNITVVGYDIRALWNGLEFENAFRFNGSNIVEDSLNTANSSTGKKEKFVLQIPDEIWKFDTKFSKPGFFLELTFALKAIGGNGVKSELSNLASIIIKEKPLLTIFEMEPKVVSIKTCKIMLVPVGTVAWVRIQLKNRYCV